MSDVSKPVILDETGKRLVEAIEGLALREGANKELLEEIKGTLQEISGKMADESKIFIVTVEETLDASTGKATAGTPSHTHKEARTAYEAGKCVFLRVISGTNSCVIPLSEVTATQLRFVTHAMLDKATTRNYQYLLVEPSSYAPNGVVIAQNTLNSTSVTCSVTIGGTTYTTVDAALAALAALHES